jgi:hypothetical protein
MEVNREQSSANPERQDAVSSSMGVECKQSSANLECQDANPPNFIESNVQDKISQIGATLVEKQKEASLSTSRKRKGDPIIYDKNEVADEVDQSDSLQLEAECGPDTVHLPPTSEQVKQLVSKFDQLTQPVVSPDLVSMKLVLSRTLDHKTHTSLQLHHTYQRFQKWIEDFTKVHSERRQGMFQTYTDRFQDIVKKDSNECASEVKQGMIEFSKEGMELIQPPPSDQVEQMVSEDKEILEEL